MITDIEGSLGVKGAVNKGLFLAVPQRDGKISISYRALYILKRSYFLFEIIFSTLLVIHTYAAMNGKDSVHGTV